MAILTHEVWEQPDEHGQMLPSLCLAGSHGDGFRSLLEPSARLVTTFQASSHFEAMSKYYAIYGREKYTTDNAWDYEPYPEEWAITQGNRSCA
jgi:hypothetical protein